MKLIFYGHTKFKDDSVPLNQNATILHQLRKLSDYISRTLAFELEEVGGLPAQ